MITSLILNLIYIPVNFLIELLPTATLPESVSSSFSAVNPYLSSLYTFLPNFTDSLLLILTIETTIGFSYFTYKVINWIIRRLPSQS